MRTRLVVIDDDEEMTDMLKLVLEPDQFEITAANSGAAGIQAVADIQPDVVMLDLLMPDMDGWQVCGAIRAFSQVPILVLSAISKPGVAARALDAGADDYLLKPMTGSLLAAHLKRLARRSHL